MLSLFPHLPSRSFIRLESSDGLVLTVDARAANMSKTISTLFDLWKVEGDKSYVDGVMKPLLLPNVDGKMLTLAMEWASHHMAEPPQVAEEEFDGLGEKMDLETGNIPSWDKLFLRALDQKSLFSLMTAADYLEMPGLVSVTCKTVANMMIMNPFEPDPLKVKAKTPQEVRAIFGLEDDLTAEEKKQGWIRMNARLVCFGQLF